MRALLLSSRPLRFLGALLLAAVLGACTDAGPSTPLLPRSPLLSLSADSPLLVCPATEERTVSKTIGVLGGILELDGHRMVVPLNAVLTPTTFSMTVPASPHLKVRIRAGGKEHFLFNKPVALTLSYARCARSDLEKTPLRVYYVDEATGAILEDLGGVDVKLTRTVTALTGHLSDYALGTPH